MTIFDGYGTIENARKGVGADTNAQAVGHHLRKEVSLMRITFHIGKYTITIIVKKRKEQASRHSAK